MSYSFSAKGDSKTEALLDAEAKFAKVVADMPVHEKDQEQVLSHARNMVALIKGPDAATEEVVVTMSGYVSHQHDGSIVSASASCGAYLSRKTA